MNDYSETEWLTLDDEIQKRFHAFAAQIHSAIPSLEPRFGKTITERFPLFSYVRFKQNEAADCEYVIVGVDIAPEDQQWRIDADVSGEESGKIYFEMPNPPFSVSSFEDLKGRVLHAAAQLAKEAKPVLLGLFGTPAPGMPSSTASLPEVAPKI